MYPHSRIDILITIIRNMKYFNCLNSYGLILIITRIYTSIYTHTHTHIHIYVCVCVACIVESYNMIRETGKFTSKSWINGKSKSLLKLHKYLYESNFCIRHGGYTVLQCIVHWLPRTVNHVPRTVNYVHYMGDVPCMDYWNSVLWVIWAYLYIHVVRKIGAL